MRTAGIADDLPKVDAIYVNAGSTHPSWAWIEALRPGGRLLFPLQPENQLGGMLLVRRPAEAGTAWPARFITRAIFIGLQGGHDEALSRELAKAFRADGGSKVRSLRLAGAPDDSCWIKGNGWWLSTAQADGSTD
jgi:protein-L-isoaspartate(D-aspartate) O-methyltransferase